MTKQSPDISAIVATFPATFGLRAFPGKIFRISTTASYIGDAGEPWLYTQVRNADGAWSDFAKGSPHELRREVVIEPVQSPAVALADLATRIVANGGDVTAAVATSEVATWSADKLHEERTKLAGSATQLDHDRAFGRVLGALNAELAKLPSDRDRLRLIVSVSREMERRLATRSVR